MRTNSLLKTIAITAMALGALASVERQAAASTQPASLLGVGGCSADSQCGAANSGLVCSSATHSCIAGCRLDAGTGNTCTGALTCTQLLGVVNLGVCLGGGATLVDAGAGNITKIGTSCASDPDCGDGASGLVCDSVTSTCIAGCRVGAGAGNGCAVGLACTATVSGVGLCVAPGCQVDSDCGGPTSGTICNGNHVCQTGCHSDGNGCATGLTCTATQAGVPGNCTTPVGPTSCTTDSQCGAIDSGLVCDQSTGSCVPGCKVDVTTGNGCPPTLVCDASFDVFGQCITPPSSSSSSTSSSSGSTSSSSSSSTSSSSSSTSSSSSSTSSSSSSSSGGSSSSSTGSSSSSSSSGGSSSGGSSGQGPTVSSSSGGSSGSSGSSGDLRTPFVDAGADAAADAPTDGLIVQGGGCNVAGSSGDNSRMAFLGLAVAAGLIVARTRKKSA